MKLDLHIHTNASDGAWPPEKVVRAAAHNGLDVIAIADHDTTASVAPAQAAAADLNLQIIPAMEASSTWEGREIHVLGYFLDAGAPALAAHAQRAVRLREERMRDMVERVNAQGMEVAFQDVLEAAGESRSTLARPHLARALVARGHAATVGDAFNRHIGDHCEAFVPTSLQTPMEAVGMIQAAGGVAVWAHPPADTIDALLPLMVEAGLHGLEVYRPSHSRKDIARLEGVCRTAGLVKGGGSDWHTPDYGYQLGDFYVEAPEVEQLLALGGM